MKLLVFASALIISVAGSAEARSYIAHSHAAFRSHYHYSRSYRPYGERDFVSHRHYTNVSGHWVHSPTRTLSGRRPAGATAHCSDGSWSFSEHARGTCSHHGGVG